MKNVLAKLTKLARQIRGLLPSRLPQGVDEYNAFIENLFNTYDLPTQDRDSIKFSVGTMIMHLGPTSAYKPNIYFALAIKAGAAKQIAGSVFYEIKERQKKLAEQQQAEATAKLTAGASDGSVK